MDVDGAEFVGETCSYMAEDKLHYRTLKKPMFVACGNAAWANRRDLTSQCGFLYIATEENLMDGHAVPCNTISRHSVRGSLQARAVQRPEEQLRDKMRWRMSGGFGTNTARHGTADLRLQDQQITASPKASVRRCVKIGKCWSVHGRQTFSRSFVCARITYQKPNETALATLRCQRDARAYKV